jgi:hypothetical protein
VPDTTGGAGSTGRTTTALSPRGDGAAGWVTIGPAGARTGRKRAKKTPIKMTVNANKTKNPHANPTPIQKQRSRGVNRSIARIILSSLPPGDQ